MLDEPAHHLAIALLIEIFPDAERDLGPDIAHRAQPVDIHAALRCEMAYRLAHARGAVGVDAEVADLALLMNDRGVAHRASRGHLEFAVPRTGFVGDADDVGNHVAGALDQNLVAL